MAFHAITVHVLGVQGLEVVFEVQTLALGSMNAVLWFRVEVLGLLPHYWSTSDFGRRVYEAGASSRMLRCFDLIV